ncbi:DUF417 family protein [Naasia sp. SYSU D00057]|uniref:DoxX family membrane protein n=1 Tax=Naasia sp. SYSU D00057 TaxID=2817380 RepID=UPI001B311E0E|nr:DUF417 family protein [Naasia sp. SYSU D00057]
MSTLLTPTAPVAATSSSLETAGRTAPTAAGPLGWILRTEEAVLRILRVVSAPALRVALAVVFIWFGALKVIGASPIADLVASMLPFLPGQTVVVGLGVFEVIAGVALLANILVPWVCAAIVVHLTSTFLVAFVHPAEVFEGGNPFLATMTGEFIAKNLVLIAAALAVAAFSRARRTR